MMRDCEAAGLLIAKRVPSGSTVGVGSGGVEERSEERRQTRGTTGEETRGGSGSEALEGALGT